MKDGNRSVRLNLRIPDKDDPVLFEQCMVTIDVVGVEKEKNTAACLIADVCSLLRCAGFCQQQVCTIALARTNDNPALVLIGDVCVLDERESQLSDKEIQCFVVIANDQGNQAKRPI